MKQIGILMLALLVALSALGGYAFLMRGITLSIASIGEAKKSVDLVGKRSALARASEQFIVDTEAERKALAGFVVDDQEVVSALETIETVARREKVEASISSVTVEVVPTLKYHEIVNVILSGEGTFTALATLASALEALPFAARLETTAFEHTSSKTWVGTYSILIVKEKAL
jgi:hypothetical protein